MKRLTSDGLHKMFNVHRTKMASFSPERDARRFAKRFVKSGATVSAATRATIEAAIAHHEAAATHLRQVRALLQGLCPDQPAKAAAPSALAKRWDAATQHMEPH